ncbi:MAG: chromosomal replication initiator protein DnaA [Candidatus Omnitrophica bacterium]|nr:chromosomal replication initiator protein DnaA [Candidatus Omnitrophota bacterium]
MAILLSKDVWRKLKLVLKGQLNPQSFNVWLAPTQAVSFKDDIINVEVPNKFFKGWLEEHYSEKIAQTLSELAGKNIGVNYIINEERAGWAQEKITNPSHAPKPALALFNINPKYTFDDFVVGSSNRFAHAASLAVAEKPAAAYNPLFLYGGVGLGKTHLMQAICHHLISHSPHIKPFYISSEKFTNQLINAIQNRTTLKFREKYRNVDVLLVDDIQFIAGKESTQEEFFHTFNALREAHKQIVISSDRPPKDIPALEERLVSRFEGGLITDIQPPDFETRMAILRKKAEKEVITVPNEVTSFIAEKIKSNIRELEGALIRVVAYALLIGREISLDLAREVLKETLFFEQEKRITIDLIQKKVAEHFDIRISDMKIKKRTRAIAFPRQIAMYLSRELTDGSLPEIGEAFGGKDHTTVLYAYDKINKIINENPDKKALINKLTSDIRG